MYSLDVSISVFGFLCFDYFILIRTNFHMAKTKSNFLEAPSLQPVDLALQLLCSNSRDFHLKQQSNKQIILSCIRLIFYVVISSNP